jgi:hypothetical protein
MRIATLRRIAVVGFGAAVLSSGAAKGVLRAGAARVDITPAAGTSLPMSGYAGRTVGHSAVHDNLYTRAIYLDDGNSQAVIVTCDLIFMPEILWEPLTQKLIGEFGIPRERLLLAGTHTHGGPALAEGAYLSGLQDKIVEAVRQARSRLQPARMGFGTGKASVNMNRRAPMAGGGWWLGSNPEGPSDKTVAVVKFETGAGEPLALFINYAVHGTVMGQQNLEITGDLPGATSRVVERALGGDVVAAWTSGAAGDQDPLYRVGNRHEDTESLGEILGAETLRVAKSIRTSPAAEIRGAQVIVECPGRKATSGRRRDLNYAFEDAGPATIRLSLLMLNHIALAGVSGEVLTNIGQRLKRESPFTATMMVTHCNGSSGYIPDDAAYEQISYEIVATRLKPGCAEDAIVRGLIALMDAN